MNPIGLLKRAVARRLERSPNLLENMGKKATVFEKILVGAAKSEKSITRIIDSPAVLDRMMRSPKVFERMLTEVSKNPESLYRVLSQRNVRRNLRAQNTFLKGMASEKVAVAKIIQHIPEQDRPELVSSIVSQKTGMLRELTDAPEAIATALSFQMGTHDTKTPQYTRSQLVVIEKLLDTLDDKATSVVSALAQRKPDLLKKGTLREHAVRSIVSDDKMLTEMFLLYVANMSNGPTPGARVHKLLKRVMKEPVFLQAMLNDAELYQFVSDILRDCSGGPGAATDKAVKAPVSRTSKTKKRAS